MRRKKLTGLTVIWYGDGCDFFSCGLRSRRVVRKTVRERERDECRQPVLVGATCLPVPPCAFVARRESRRCRWQSVDWVAKLCAYNTLYWSPLRTVSIEGNDFKITRCWPLLVHRRLDTSDIINISYNNTASFNSVQCTIVLRRSFKQVFG